MTGHIKKRLTKHGPRYDAVVSIGRDRIWKTFQTRKAAEDFVADTVSDVGAGTYRRVTPTLMTDVFERWKDALIAAETLGQIKRSTRRGYVSVVTHHLIPFFGAVKSDALSSRKVSDWKHQAAEDIANGELTSKTFNNAVGVLSTCLQWARDQHFLAANPLPRKLRARRKKTARPVVQGAEIARLWRAATGQDQVVVGLALFAGLRRGEIFGLRWEDIVWPKGRTRAALRVTQAYVQGEITSPKSEAGRRTVFLPPRLVDVLRRHHQTRPPVPLTEGSAFLVRQDDGKPIDPDNWHSRALPVIRETAKLPETITLHALRHTFGSLLLADNVPVKHVSEQLGHANVAITLDIYQHTLRATSSTATRQLDKHIPTEAPKLRLVKRGAA